VSLTLEATAHGVGCSVVDEDLAYALALADVADRIALPRFRAADLAVETKPDMTPVTEADRAVERALRERIAHDRPGDAVLGEEFGGESSPAQTGVRWIIDPIDGTKNYVRGIHVWATLIALQRDGRTVAGVASAPALGRRWWAARDQGAFADGRPIRVSNVTRLEDAQVCYSGLGGWRRAGLRDRLLTLADRSWRSRGFGDFWMHALVAEGCVDAAAEPEVKLWDMAAVQVIVEEAGGRFTDLAGRASPDGGSGVSTNGRLHDEVLAVLSGTSGTDGDR
jgi:histidinol-phosphatase